MKDSSFVLIKVIVKAIIRQIPVVNIWAEDIADLVQGAAKDVHAKWIGERSPSQRVIDVEVIAESTPQQIRDAIAPELADIADPALREAVVTYAQAVPARIRATLVRPEDPSGRTIPAGMVPQSVEDVLRYLPERAPRFSAGDCPVGSWQLVELIGGGGFSEVWHAQHKVMKQRHAALKFCLDPNAAHELAALDRETHLLSRLEQAAGEHPGIVRIIETYLDANPPCLAYEYVPGGTLAGVILEWHRLRGRPTPDEAARIIFRLAEIMAVCHAQEPPIVHRDLKPANILVQHVKDSEPRLRITDFGIGGISGSEPAFSKIGPTIARLQVASVNGSHSPLYASPQQIAGADPNVQDDVFALGVIWHQLLDGDLKLGAPSGDWMEELRERGMEESLIRLLASCLAPKVERRLASATALMNGFANNNVGTPRSEKVSPNKPTAVPTNVIDGSKAGEQRSFEISPGVNMDFCWCPPGEFLMGDSKVKRQIPQGFWMARHPCTQQEWKSIMNTEPSHFKGSQLPVESVNWNEAHNFLTKLKAPAGWFYGLPTESQWEYACRAGTTSAFAFGETLNGRRIMANCEGIVGRTSDVGNYPANSWGLHDMHGNVWEWCADWYADKLTAGPDTGGPSSGTHRVARGGHWSNASSNCRSARRHGSEPAIRDLYLGFRVALVPAAK